MKIDDYGKGMVSLDYYFLFFFLLSLFVFYFSVVFFYVFLCVLCVSCVCLVCVLCVSCVCFLQVSFDEDVVLWQFPCWQLEMHYTNQQCLKLQKKETKDWKDSNKYCGILVIEQIQHDKLNPPINWHQTLSSHFESPK